MVESYIVKDIMTFNVATFDKRDKLTDAIQIMADHKVNSILIVEKGFPIGVVTERIIMRNVLAKGLNYKNLKCKDMMEYIRAVSPYDPVTYVAKMMRELKLKWFPVVDEGRIVGVINQSDIVAISTNLHKKHKNVMFHHKIQLIIIFGIIVFLFGFFFYVLINKI
ncbi:CBS domain-containing protein [Candidatus Woesearchaeota archaeon]|nr:CBS domain-containing protein [Candidatus Woesearchaeota archaeon]